MTPCVFISEDTWKYSFGKFLEAFFYNRDAVLSACSCNLQTAAILNFGCGKLVARFTYDRIDPYKVFIRSSLPFDGRFQKSEAVRRMDVISTESAMLFIKFQAHISKVSREARSLFNSAMNRPEHLQTVLSELNSIASEVDQAAQTLQVKILSAAEECRRSVNESLFRFPWFARRYLYTLMSAWNEKLSTVGRAISAMRKLASGKDMEQYNEALTESMKRLRQLNSHYSGYNVADITQALPALDPEDPDDDEFEETEMDVDADVLASRRRFRAVQQQQQQVSSSSSAATEDRAKPTKSLGTRREAEETEPKTGGVRSALTRFFNRGGRESDPYTVDLGLFAQGRPRLTPGSVVVPVIDDQWSTIIAYSLASTEYARQFKVLAKTESETTKTTLEQQMLARNKSHIKHSFKDYVNNGRVSCKFVCTSYWATQFHAVRQVFLTDKNTEKERILDIDHSYIESLSSAMSWAASGGKSGASFMRTSDDRFVIKCISRTELQMFLDCAPAYFEYLSKAFFHGL